MSADPNTPNPGPPPTPPGMIPPNVPEWALVAFPPMPEGQAAPAFAVDFRVGLTDPDAAGHQWAVLIQTDGTLTSQVRIPAQLAGPVGLGIAQALDKVHKKYEAQDNGASKLILPNGAAGGLFVPGGPPGV
jgi:hypothetical protein